MHQKTKAGILIIGPKQELQQIFGMCEERDFSNTFFVMETRWNFCRVFCQYGVSAPGLIGSSYPILLVIKVFQKADSVAEIEALADLYPNAARIGIFQTLTEKTARKAFERRYSAIFSKEHFHPAEFQFTACRELFLKLNQDILPQVIDNAAAIGEINFLQHTFWRNTILTERWFGELEMIYKGRELGIDFSLSDQFLVVLLRKHDRGMPETAGQELVSAWDSFQRAQEYLAITDDYEQIEVSFSVVAIIVRIEKDSVESISRSLNFFINQNMHQTHTWWSCYIGNIAPLTMLRDQYLELEQIMNKNIVPLYRLFFLREVPLVDRIFPIEGKDWITKFAEGKTEFIKDEIDDYIQGLIQEEKLSPDHIFSIANRLAMGFYASMEMRKVKVDDIITNPKYLGRFEKSGKSIEGLTEFFNYLQNINQEVIDQLQKSKFLSTQIFLFIRNKIEEKVTRDEIANHFFMNPDYISHVFKKETGISLTTAVNQEKIKKAKEYLLATSMPVSEIASRLGIDNYSYFTRIFKAETGKSPQEYRKKR